MFRDLMDWLVKRTAVYRMLEANARHERDCYEIRIHSEMEYTHNVEMDKEDLQKQLQDQKAYQAHLQCEIGSLSDALLRAHNKIEQLKELRKRDEECREDVWKKIEAWRDECYKHRDEARYWKARCDNNFAGEIQEELALARGQRECDMERIRLLEAGAERDIHALEQCRKERDEWKAKYQDAVAANDSLDREAAALRQLVQSRQVEIKFNVHPIEFSDRPDLETYETVCQIQRSLVDACPRLLGGCVFFERMAEAVARSLVDFLTRFHKKGNA